MLWIKVKQNKRVESDKGGGDYFRVVRDGFFEKTTSEQIITLGTSSVKITKLATVINIEIRNCVEKI